MITREVTIGGKYGLYSKAAAVFIQKASNFKAEIWIEKDERRANVKSLLGLLSLGIGSGSRVILTADGEDEGKVLIELSQHLSGDMEEEA